MSKVKDVLPAPSQCDACCSLNIELTTNDKIYGRKYGEWPLVYFCHDCNAAVGCHPRTEIPLGIMADQTTRQLRSKAHGEFDKLWQSGLMTRSKAYGWLAFRLNIEPSECHISWLSKDQLSAVVTIVSDYLANNHEVLLRRKVKHETKQQKQNERASRNEKRTIEHIRRRKSKR